MSLDLVALPMRLDNSNTLNKHNYFPISLYKDSKQVLVIPEALWEVFMVLCIKFLVLGIKYTLKILFVLNLGTDFGKAKLSFQRFEHLIRQAHEWKTNLIKAQQSPLLVGDS